METFHEDDIVTATSWQCHRECCDDLIAPGDNVVIDREGTALHADCVFGGRS